MSTDILSEKKVPAKSGVPGYYIFMAAAILCLYAVNNISYHQIQPIDPTLTSYYSAWIVAMADRLAVMQVPYASQEFISCLWAINLFLAFCIVGNFMLLLYRPRWFHHLILLVIFALAILAVYIVYQVFPFNIDEESQKTLIRISLWVIMAAAAVAMVLRLYQLIKALSEIERSKPPVEIALSAISPDLPSETVQPGLPAADQMPAGVIQTPADVSLSTLPPEKPADGDSQPSLSSEPEPTPPPSGEEKKG